VAAGADRGRRGCARGRHPLQAASSIGNAIKNVWNGIVAILKEAYKLFSDTPLGGLFNAGRDILGGNFTGAAGALVQGYTFGGVSLPASQSTTPSNSSVPAVQHRAGGGDTHLTSHTTVNLDGRQVAEQVVHQVQKRAALS
jgi:hypothetical protein